MKYDYSTIEGFKFWCQKVLPLVYDESLSYYEVLCKIQFKLNEIINNQNNLNEAFNKLLKWIDSQIEMYTKDKLQEWLDDGTLENMIMALGQIVKYFNTTEEMLQTDNLVVGQVVKTLGYSNINDKGDCLFKITNSVSNNLQLKTKNNLYATLITNGNINVASYGVFPNSDDVKDLLIDILKYNNNIMFNSGVYVISDTVNITRNDIHIIGNSTTIQCNNNTSYGHTLGIYAENNDINNVIIENINVINTSSGDNDNAIGVGSKENYKISNVSIINCQGQSNHKGITFQNNCHYINIKNCSTKNNKTYGISIETKCDYVNIENCNIEENNTYGIALFDVNHCNISYSHIENNNGAGIYVNGHDIKIYENLIQSNGNGVQTSTSKEIIIEHNDITSNNNQSILPYKSNVIVKNNNITGFYGIVTIDLDNNDISILNNYINVTNTQNVLINLTNVNNLIIDSNVFGNTNVNCIDITTLNKCLINNNISKQSDIFLKLNNPSMNPIITNNNVNAVTYNNIASANNTKPILIGNVVTCTNINQNWTPICQIDIINGALSTILN